MRLPCYEDLAGNMGFEADRTLQIPGPKLL